MTTWLEAEMAADGARARCGQSERIPVDPFAALAAFGVQVLRMPSGVEGVYVREKRASFALVNSHTALVRQRFTAAHEIGHHVIHRPDSPPRFIDVVIGGEGQTDPIEDEADAFAAAFLMPEDAVRRLAEAWGSGLDAINAAVATFVVSKEAAARRMVDLDLATKADAAVAMKDKPPMAVRVADLNRRRPGGDLVAPDPKAEMNVQVLDPTLNEMVARIEALGLLDNPRSLARLTP